jgi:hypothetical protein
LVRRPFDESEIETIMSEREARFNCSKNIGTIIAYTRLFLKGGN